MDVHCAFDEHEWPRPNDATHACGVTVVSQSPPLQSVSLEHVVPQTEPTHL